MCSAEVIEAVQALGRGWTDDELAAWLASARVSYERPADIAVSVARANSRYRPGVGRGQLYSH